MFVLVRIQLRNHVDARPVRRFRCRRAYALYTYYIQHDIKFVMLQVRENEISLRRWSCGTALLSTLDGTLFLTSMTGCEFALKFKTTRKYTTCPATANLWIFKRFFENQFLNIILQSSIKNPLDHMFSATG